MQTPEQVRQIVYGTSDERIAEKRAGRRGRRSRRRMRRLREIFQNPKGLAGIRQF